LFFAPGSAALKDYAADPLLCVPLEEKQDRVAEMFDRYNLLALPVVDRDQHVIGVITVDDIVALLRH
jgi:magnesium transporter